MVRYFVFHVFRTLVSLQHNLNKFLRNLAIFVESNQKIIRRKDAIIALARFLGWSIELILRKYFRPVIYIQFFFSNNFQDFLLYQYPIMKWKKTSLKEESTSLLCYIRCSAHKPLKICLFSYSHHAVWIHMLFAILIQPINIDVRHPQSRTNCLRTKLNEFRERWKGRENKRR